MTAHGERMLMTVAQRRLEIFERCPSAEPLAFGTAFICMNCSFEVHQFGERDWVHSEVEVATMRRMAAGGAWVETE